MTYKELLGILQSVQATQPRLLTEEVLCLDSFKHNPFPVQLGRLANGEFQLYMETKK